MSNDEQREAAWGAHCVEVLGQGQGWFPFDYRVGWDKGWDAAMAAKLLSHDLASGQEYRRVLTAIERIGKLVPVWQASAAFDTLQHDRWWQGYTRARGEDADQMEAALAFAAQPITETVEQDAGAHG